MGFLDNAGVTRLVTDLKSRFTAPKSIAYVESTTAKTNHTAGDHFMIGEQLKRATSAIATGETIGATNSADDTVQGQIDTLRDSVGRMSLQNTIKGLSFQNDGTHDIMLFEFILQDNSSVMLVAEQDGMRFGYKEAGVTTWHWAHH